MGVSPVSALKVRDSCDGFIWSIVAMSVMLKSGFLKLKRRSSFALSAISGAWILLSGTKPSENSAERILQRRESVEK